MMAVGLMLGLILTSAFWLWQTLRNPQTLPFHQLRINGQFQHIKTQQLRRLIQPQIHNGFFTIQLEPIKQSIMANPWIENVAIRRVPGTLIVNIREQQPVARWNDHYLINDKGQFFPAPNDAPPGLPSLRGPEDNQALVLENYKQINHLLNQIHLQIKEIKLDERQSWQMMLNNDINVTIGRDDILPRIQRLIHWYPQIINDRVDEIIHIDLRYTTNIAVQFKNLKRSD